MLAVTTAECGGREPHASYVRSPVRASRALYKLALLHAFVDTLR